MTKTRVEGILVLFADHLAPYAQTMREHIHSWHAYSTYPVYEVNTALGFPSALARLDFAVVVLHYSLFGTVPYEIGGRYLDFLQRAGGSYKVGVFQDDYRFWRERHEFIDRYELDCVYTLLDERWHGETFLAGGRSRKVVQALPGYVSRELVEAATRHGRPDQDRPIDIGYRGRDVPYYLGAAGREKTFIAHEFSRRAAGLELRLDVSANPGDRLYGDAWYEFLGGCRGVLGVESGASVVDVDGEVGAAYERLIRANSDLTWEEFERLAEPELTRWDYRITDLVASPRVFEAAAFRCCQILFEGRYSGLVEPGRHYLPLAKDFANFDEVVERFADPAVRRELTTAAYDDLIRSGLFTYERFIGDFDRLLVGEGALQPDPRAEPGPGELKLLQRPRRRRLLGRARMLRGAR
jgi:hypothetical protein